MQPGRNARDRAICSISRIPKSLYRSQRESAAGNEPFDALLKEAVVLCVCVFFFAVNLAQKFSPTERAAYLLWQTE